MSRSQKARIAGLLYIVASAVGVIRLLYIPNILFVDGNPTATAANIVAHESLFRLGIASELVAAVLWMFVPLALYQLLRDVDQTLGALMVILGSLMQVPLFVIAAVADAAALAFAQGGAYQSGQIALDMHHELVLASLIFGGLWLFPFGILVYRSRFLPRVLGLWLVLAGFAWLFFSFTGILWPAYENQAYSITQPVALGEVATMLWLVVVGATSPKTLSQHTAAAS